jgi:energy-coupling factor transporter ATP-binding protein EcfA2
MTQKIIVFAGAAQSGKSTAAKYISGVMLKQAKLTDWFEIHDESGDLYLQATDEANKKVIVKLDLAQSDWEFIQYAVQNIWPYAKIYSYASQLKSSVSQIFGLNPQNLYGSNEDKNKPTHIKWQNIIPIINTMDNVYVPEREFLTHREVLQYFGTNICRKIDPDCWTEACFGHIEAEDWPNVIIDDCRFENEVNAAHQHGAKVVLLTHNPYPNNHVSEQILTMDRTKFDYVIENANISIREKEKKIDDILLQTGWLTASL